MSRVVSWFSCGARRGGCGMSDPWWKGRATCDEPTAIYTLHFAHEDGAEFSVVFTNFDLAERAINEAQEHNFRCREWSQIPVADATTDPAERGKE